MIYDNEECLRQAERLIKQYGHDLDLLKKEISGELCRFHRLGQVSVMSRVERALEVADKVMPK